MEPFLTRLEPADQPLTGPEHAHRAHLLLAASEEAERNMMGKVADSGAIVDAILILADRIGALTHAQLATAAAGTHQTIGASSRLRRAWSNMFDPTGTHADKPPHPAEG